MKFTETKFRFSRWKANKIALFTIFFASLRCNWFLILFFREFKALQFFSQLFHFWLFSGENIVEAFLEVSRWSTSRVDSEKLPFVPILLQKLMRWVRAKGFLVLWPIYKREKRELKATRLANTWSRLLYYLMDFKLFSRNGNLCTRAQSESFWEGANRLRVLVNTRAGRKKYSSRHFLWRNQNDEYSVCL